MRSLSRQRISRDPSDLTIDNNPRIACVLKGILLPFPASFSGVRNAKLVTAPPEVTVSELASLMQSKGIDAVPILRDGRLVGIVATLDEARIPEKKWAQVRARDMMTTRLTVGCAHEFLFEALNRMTHNNIGHLLIVVPDSPDKLVSRLAVHDIAITYESHGDAQAPED